MQILKHTCPFTGGNFKLIMRRDQDSKLTFFHALTGEQFDMEIKDGKIDALKVNGRYSVIASSVREYDAMARGRKW